MNTTTLMQKTIVVVANLVIAVMMTLAVSSSFVVAAEITPEGNILFTEQDLQSHPGLKPEQRTVPRHPEGGSATVARKGQCVLDLTAPKTTADCKLGPIDPPAKLIVKGWYPAKAIPETPIAIQKATPRERDAMAAAMLSREGKCPAAFWHTGILVARRYLDAPPGGTNRWPRSRLNRYYSEDELQQAKDAALKWAKAWKTYGGPKAMRSLPDLVS